VTAACYKNAKNIQSIVSTTVAAVKKQMPSNWTR
jgi:hypothetical protein